MTLLWTLALLFVGVQLGVALINARSFPVLGRGRAAPTATGVPRSTVSILIPARDEIETLPRTLPRVLAQGADEVVVLDDGSSDGTGAWLREFAAREPRLRVLDGAPLPPGWLGKPWACHQLAGAATGELLCFTDADVGWEPGALDALLAFRDRSHAGLVTVWPRMITGSWLERVVVPQVDLILLGGLPQPAVARLPFAALAAGNGQLMLFDRPAYRGSGGHAAVAAEVLEDVRLAQAAKRAGVRLGLALGGRLLATRMYRSPAQLWEGFSKNLLAAVGWSRPALVLLIGLNLLAYTLSWPLAWFEPRWLAVGLSGWVLRAVTAATPGRSPWEAPLQTLAPLALLRLGSRALRRGRRISWKGRRYDPPAAGGA